MADYEQSEGISAGTLVLAFVTGAAIGAIGALLLAPHSGEASRDRIRTYARQTGDNIRDLADRAGETWHTAMEKSRDFVDEQRSVLKEALDAGREAMKRQRDTEQKMG